MLFKRRKEANFLDRMRTLFWPRMSFSRTIHYVRKRVLRLTATPHAIAAGFAAGVFASFTPFVGFHFLIAFAIAYVIAGNMMAAALGTAVGNPLTFPLIWSSTYELGHIMLHAERPSTTAPVLLVKHLMHLDITTLWTPLIKPMLFGGIPIGLVAGIASYVTIRWAVGEFQARRRARLAARAKARVAAAPLKVPKTLVAGE